MVTGVPKSDKTSMKNNNHNGVGSIKDGSSLEYPGKIDKKIILKTPSSSFETIWDGRNSDQKLSDNRLYFGDNLGFLASLLKDKNVKGKVRLIYIDPPFATQTVFHSRNLEHAYDDVLSGPKYLEFLRQRLVLLRELLAPDGSIYVHLDDKMVSHLKIIMDEIFEPKNFRNLITRKKCNPKNFTRRQYGSISDYILFYSKSDKFVWNRAVETWTEERAKKEYQCIEPETGRRYKKVPVHAPGTRNGETGKTWRDMKPPPGKHWQYTPKRLDEMDDNGEIYWSPTGNPRRKVYLDNSSGVGVQDIWMDFKDAHNQNIKITGYPTEKNPALLKRIIEASSNPGDLVLDCFVGSGTTLAVSSFLNRRWIGADNGMEAIKTILRRFAIGMEPMGDFVSERNGAKNKSGETGTLFDSLDSGQKTDRISPEHKTITNFIFQKCSAIDQKSEYFLKEWLSLTAGKGIESAK